MLVIAWLPTNINWRNFVFLLVKESINVINWRQLLIFGYNSHTVSSPHELKTQQNNWNQTCHKRTKFTTQILNKLNKSLFLLSEYKNNICHEKHIPTPPPKKKTQLTSVLHSSQRKPAETCYWPDEIIIKWTIKQKIKLFSISHKLSLLLVSH